MSVCKSSHRSCWKTSSFCKTRSKRPIHGNQTCTASQLGGLLSYDCESTRVNTSRTLQITPSPSHFCPVPNRSTAKGRVNAHCTELRTVQCVHICRHQWAFMGFKVRVHIAQNLQKQVRDVMFVLSNHSVTNFNNS